MRRDFIADLLYYIYSEDEKNHPLSPEAQARLAQKIDELLTSQQAPIQKQNEGEDYHG